MLRKGYSLYGVIAVSGVAQLVKDRIPLVPAFSEKPAPLTYNRFNYFIFNLCGLYAQVLMYSGTYLRSRYGGGITPSKFCDIGISQRFEGVQFYIYRGHGQTFVQFYSRPQYTYYYTYYIHKCISLKDRRGIKVKYIHHRTTYHLEVKNRAMNYYQTREHHTRSRDTVLYIMFRFQHHGAYARYDITTIQLLQVPFI